MSNVVNLGDFKRLRASERVSSLVTAGESARDGMMTATIIGCAGCQGTDFQLLDNGGVVCSRCHTLINNLRWRDERTPPDAA